VTSRQKRPRATEHAPVDPGRFADALRAATGRSHDPSAEEFQIHRTTVMDHLKRRLVSKGDLLDERSLIRRGNGEVTATEVTICGPALTVRDISTGIPAADTWRAPSAVWLSRDAARWP
jgi:hypothetical protein